MLRLGWRQSTASFANGAATSAMMHLFNHESHSGGLTFKEKAKAFFSGLGEGATDVAMSFRRVAEGIGEFAGHLSVDPAGTILAVHDQITTNLADGYFLLANTSLSDITRDFATFGDLYVNDASFRADVTDFFSGSAVGLATGSGPARWVKFGEEIKFGSNLRIAPFGNRTGNQFGRFPHYHRRVTGSNGQTVGGQGIGRHRPWETKSNDTSFFDRF